MFSINKSSGFDYYQSTKDFASTFQLSNKKNLKYSNYQTINPQNIKSKTGSAYLQNNWTRPSTTDGLPRNTKSIATNLQIHRSMSTNSRNTKGRMDFLDDTLQKIGNQINGLRIQTKQSKQYCSFMKEELLNRKLPQITNKLQHEIRRIEKSMKIGLVSNQSRTYGVKQDIQALKSSTKQIKNMLSEINLKMHSIQNAMGFYCGQDKFKS